MSDGPRARPLTCPDSNMPQTTIVRLMLAAAFGAVAAVSLPGVSGAQEAARPIPRGGRWQLRLAGGAYLFDVRPLRATGDSLVVARLDSAPAAHTVAVTEIEELRLVQPSLLRFQSGAESPFGELAGSEDVVFSLTGVDAAERRRILEEVLLAAAEPAGR